jgi:hypothetical protein
MTADFFVSGLQERDAGWKIEKTTKAARGAAFVVAG